MQPKDVRAHLISRRGGAGLDVVQKLKEKDEYALQALMEQYGGMLLRTACLLMKDRQAAEEAVQDTFIQAYNKIRQLNDPSKLTSWLCRILINRCRMRQRTWSWKHLLPSDRVEQIMETSGSGPGPEDQLLVQLRNNRLSDAIRRLDYKYREVITLYYYNEMSVADITELLESNENTIKARLARGRSRLKAMLEQKEDGDEG
ncbi:sigma-70 family RNA polymerase sigma factor [Paenibacillus tarimensis]